MEEQDLLNKNQHDFSRAGPCITNWIEVIQLAVDFQNIFDKVTHQMFLNKLSSHGM